MCCNTRHRTYFPKTMWQPLPTRASHAMPWQCSKQPPIQLTDKGGWSPMIASFQSALRDMCYAKKPPQNCTVLLLPTQQQEKQTEECHVLAALRCLRCSMHRIRRALAYALLIMSLMRQAWA